MLKKYIKLGETNPVIFTTLNSLWIAVIGE
jgi:hypothetical protein